MSRNEKAWKFKRALLQKEEPNRAKTLSNVKVIQIFYLMHLILQKERQFLILENREFDTFVCLKTRQRRRQQPLLIGWV